MRARTRHSTFLHRGLGGLGTVLASVLACSSPPPGNPTCAPPPFLSSACDSCLETACSAAVATTCSSFSSCYCDCIAEAGADAVSCTLSCANSSCTSAEAACINQSVQAGGACAPVCGGGSAGSGTGSGPGSGGSQTISCTSPASGCVAYFDAPASFQSSFGATCMGQGQVIGSGCPAAGVEGCCTHPPTASTLSFENCLNTGCGP